MRRGRGDQASQAKVTPLNVRARRRMSRDKTAAMDCSDGFLPLAGRASFRAQISGFRVSVLRKTPQGILNLLDGIVTEKSLMNVK